MPAVVLYREGVTLGERWARCGFGLPLKSLRASWQRVQVDVDHLEFSVRTATRHVVMMPPGRHEIRVRGRGFAPSVATVDLIGDQRVIVAITPQYLESVSRSTPLGQLLAHVVSWARGASAVPVLQELAFVHFRARVVDRGGSWRGGRSGGGVRPHPARPGRAPTACVRFGRGTNAAVQRDRWPRHGGALLAAFLRLACTTKGWSTSGSRAAAHLDLMPRRAVTIALPGTGHEPRKGGEGS